MTVEKLAERILIVDDDIELCEALARYFENHDFEVCYTLSAENARSLLADGQVDAIILDLHMPGEDGLSLAWWIKHGKDDSHRKSNPALIMLTGSGSVMDRVLGLELGADDYLVKPCSMRELLARVRALLRRSKPKIEGESYVKVGGCLLDPALSKVFDASGGEIQLTRVECGLVRVFAENPARVLSREELKRRVHGDIGGNFGRSIDIHITRIRKKIEVDARRPRLIRTVRGQGYVFMPE